MEKLLLQRTINVQLLTNFQPFLQNTGKIGYQDKCLAQE